MPLVNAHTVLFNGNNLQSVDGVSVLSVNPYKPARRKVYYGDIARSDKSKVYSAFYVEKEVEVKLAISRATRGLTESALDNLLQILQGREKTLIMLQSGGQRTYTVTLADTVVREDGGAYMEVVLIFKTSDHFGYDSALSLLLQVSNFTSPNKTDQISVGGSAPWQVPIITITFSTIAGGTSKTVIVGNDGTGQTITVTRTWASGDVLEIDSLNQTVKVNGIDVAFSGAFPEWAPGTGYVTYSDDFTSRTFSNTMRYYRRWV